MKKIKDYFKNITGLTGDILCFKSDEL